MTRHKKGFQAGDPKPLDFDHDKDPGCGDHLQEPFMTEADARGDSQTSQYYAEEEAISPEEVKDRKEEGDFS